jgi:hypothetical protein
MSIEASYQRAPQDTRETIQRPDIFSRGALELTFRLLRSEHPSLSLAVRNLLADTSVPLPDEAFHSPLGDHFYIHLEAQIVGKIVDALTKLGQSALMESRQDTGRLVVLRTLIKEWMTLAEWIILNADQSPTSYH